MFFPFVGGLAILELNQTYIAKMATYLINFQMFQKGRVIYQYNYLTVNQSFKGLYNFLSTIYL